MQIVLAIEFLRRRSSESGSDAVKAPSDIRRRRIFDGCAEWYWPAKVGSQSPANGCRVFSRTDGGR